MQIKFIITVDINQLAVYTIVNSRVSHCLLIVCNVNEKFNGT